MKSVRLITDGSCLGNPGRGGWAAILRYGNHVRELSGSEARTTNNRMEMTAVVKGLNALREPCEVTVELDSEYVRNGVTSWVHSWGRRGWKTASGDPVKNRDLWEQLQAAASAHKVRWVWVKGHSDHEDNNRCDHLARAAAERASPNDAKARAARRKS